MFLLKQTIVKEFDVEKMLLHYRTDRKKFAKVEKKLQKW